MCSRAAHGGGSPSIQKERLTAELSATHSAPRQLEPAAESTASSASLGRGSQPCSQPLATRWNNWSRQNTPRVEKPQRGTLLAEKSG